MTDVYFPATARPGAPIYQTLRRAGSRELISLHINDHQAAGQACILCNSRELSHPDSVSYGRLLGAHTDLIACAACVEAWPDGLP